MNVLTDNKLLREAANHCFNKGYASVHEIAQELHIGIFEAVLIKEHLVKMGVISPLGKLAIIDSDIIEQLFPRRTNSDAFHSISESFYSEISFFINELKHFLELVFKEDSILLDLITKRAIHYMIIHDFIETLDFIGINSFTENTLEVIPICLMIDNSGMKGKLNDTLSIDHERLVEKYKNKEFLNEFKLLKEQYEDELAFDKTSRPRSTGHRLNSNLKLSFANYLFDKDSSLLGGYITVVFKFANLVSFADRKLSHSEKELLAQVKSISF